MQSEKYFSKSLTKKYFNFKEDFKQKLKEKYKEAFSKKTILISIRRGDFTNNPDFYQPTLKYYYSALILYFDYWKEQNIVFISDEMDYCKFHFGFLENAFFAENLNDIEQLCLGTLCDDFIISNSTFSWWVAWLGEKAGSKIIRPERNFIGKLEMQYDETDYFPERWLMHTYNLTKIVLKNVALIYCVDNFSSENKKKLLTSLNYISFYFEVTILILTTYKKELQLFLKEYNYQNQNILYTDNNYQDAKEQLIKKGFEIFVNWDFKYFVPPFRIIYAINLIKLNNENAIGLSNYKLKYLQWFLHNKNFEVFNDLGAFLNFYKNKSNYFSSENTIVAFHKSATVSNNLNSLKDFNVIFIEDFQYSFNKIYNFKSVFINAYLTLLVLIKMKIKKILKKK